MDVLPTPEQLAYARECHDRRRKHSMTVLITGDVVETVANEVIQYVGEDVDYTPTAEEVARRILSYVATVIEPLMVANPEVK